MGTPTTFRPTGSRTPPSPSVGIPDKLYYTALPRSALHGFRETMAAAGIEMPTEVEERPDFGTPDGLITTYVDCSAVTGRKYASLSAHASQSENIFFLRMGEELFGYGHAERGLHPGAGHDELAHARGRPLRRPAGGLNRAVPAGTEQVTGTGNLRIALARSA